MGLFEVSQGVRYEIRKVKMQETESAFNVLVRVAEWLQKKGRRQRISKTTFATFEQWQLNGANYLVLDKQQIAGIFSLPREPLTDWPNVEQAEPVMWLRALATDPGYRGKGVGGLAVRAALKIVGTSEPLYLDCVSDFLPDYYQSLGFEIIARQSREYPDESQPFDITLLKQTL